MGVRWNGNPVILPIRTNGAYRLLGIDERFFLVISLGHDFGEGRNKYGKAAAGLRFQYDGETVIDCHGFVPVSLRTG